MKRSFLLMIILLVGFGLAACQQSNIEIGLQTVGSKETLKTLVTSSRDVFNYGPEETTDAVGDQKVEDRTSETNSQVEGVIEGDVVKVDENYIYQIDQDKLKITSIKGSLEVVYNQTLSSDNTYTYLSDLYLTPHYLVVIGYTYTYFYEDTKEDFYYVRGSNQTTIYVFELETFSLVKTYELSGYLNLSRQIDQTLVVMTSTYIDLELEDPRPIDVIDGVINRPSYEEIYYHESLEKQVFNTIYLIELDEEIKEERFVFLGSYYYGVSYVSKNGIYLTSYRYEFIDSSYLEDHRVFAFLFENSAIVFGGYQSFKGYVLNQFSIDEYDGHLRLLSTEGFGDSIVNHLYIYKKTLIDGINQLELVSHLDEGIGKPRERIFSARFNQDELTVVTFEQTDPFYVIDLSDQTNPVVVGQLEIPGFSTYQHVYQENVVLGIGVETEGQIQVGLKLSMYDVSNQDKPVEIGLPLVLRNDEFGYTYGEALYNHKAILFDIENNYFGFSVERYTYDDYRYNYINEYVLFGVDLDKETPIEVIKTISHQSNEFDSNYHVSIKRAVYVGNYLYVISPSCITKHDIGNQFNETASVVFD